MSALLNISWILYCQFIPNDSTLQEPPLYFLISILFTVIHITKWYFHMEIWASSFIAQFNGS